MMRSRYSYIRKLLNVDDDGGGGTDDDSPRNTGSSLSSSSSSRSRVSPLPSSSSSSSSSTVENGPPFKPTLGFDSSMALTILILLSALFFMVFFSMYLRRFADDNNNSFNLSRRRRRPSSATATATAVNAIAAAAARFDASSSFSSSNGLDPSIIRSLPLYSYNGNGNTTDDDEPILICSVCLSEFEEKETMKVIPYCGHAFHPQCIDMWIYSHSSCPLCRSTQLFREGISSGASTAAWKKEKEMKKKDCLVVEVEVDVRSSQKQFYSEHNNNHHHRIVINECESLGKSTVESGGDTSSSVGVVVVERKEALLSGDGLGLRRISSWSGGLIDEKVLLKRSLSF